MSQITMRARMRVTVEIDCGGSWGADCTVEQLQKQAAEGGIARLNQALRTGTEVRIVGLPEITAMWSADRK